MKTPHPSIVLAIAIAALLPAVQSCHKDKAEAPTFIKGKVIDIKTGTPLAGTVISYQYRQVVDGKDQYTENATTTDASGFFAFTIFGSFGANVRMEGYQSKDMGLYLDGAKITINYEKDNDIGSIGLYPLDGVCKIILYNKPGGSDAIYAYLKSPIMQSQGAGVLAITKGKIDTIQEGHSLNAILNIPANDMAKIYWSNTPFNFDSDAPFTDSFYVGKGDTTTYQIDF